MARTAATGRLPWRAASVWLAAVGSLISAAGAQQPSAPVPGPALRAPPDPAPQPTIPDGSASPEVPAAAPARLVPTRAAGRGRDAVPEGERDQVVVRWDAEALGPTPQAGRVIVVFRLVSEQGATSMPPLRWDTIGDNQCVVGGAMFALDGPGVDVASEGSWWPVRPDDLEGEFVIEAILDPAGSYAGLGDGGSPTAPRLVATLDPAASDLIELTLSTRAPAERVPEGTGIIALHVSLMGSDHSAAAGPQLNAAVILPPDHPGDASADVRWPVVLAMPDVGEDWRVSTELAPAIRSAMEGGILPRAIWVVLDPRTLTGYLGGADLARHGAYHEVIASVLLPNLADSFGACSGASDVVAVGVGVGGWAALRLAAALPLRVSAAFAVAPAIPFGGAVGEISFRDTASEAATVQWLGAGTHRVLLTVADEVALAKVIAPDGSSGRWIDTWRPFLQSGDLVPLVEATWADSSESISRSWAIVPLRDEHLASGTSQQFFDWFDRRCVQEAKQGRFTPSGRGGVIPAGEVPSHQRWTVLVGVLGPEIRDHFRASLRGGPGFIH